MTITAADDLPIEDAWATLADGLHVHRWFLHVAPVLEATDGQLWQADPEQTGKRIPLCGTEVTFIAEDAERITLTFVAQADQLIKHAELGYLVQLGLSCVIVSNRSALVTPQVARIEPAGSPLGLASRLLTAAAAGWLRLFATLGPSSRQQVVGLTRWDRADTITAEAGLGLAVRIRLYEALLAKPGLPMSLAIGADEARTELAAMRVEAEAIRPEVYQAAEPLPLIAQDLLITQFPGPNRFAKYQNGGGPGQG